MLKAPASGGHYDPEHHQLGDRPAPSAEGLGPGVAEGSGLELTGQHEWSDERPDQRRYRLEDEATLQKRVRGLEDR